MLKPANLLNTGEYELRHVWNMTSEEHKNHDKPFLQKNLEVYQLSLKVPFLELYNPSDNAHDLWISI